MDHQVLLILAVLAVGVFHTLVPDHWVPITLIARQHGWTKGEVARAAAIAGTGHAVSTLLLGLIVWIAGVAFATKFGNLVSTVSSIALIAFGGWIAISSLRELQSGGGHGHGHPHAHEHAHDRAHSAVAVAANDPPLREQGHKRPLRTTLLLILGSSPMVEGIPAFFAAAKYGVGLILVMAAVFAISTIATYVALCIASLAGLERMRFGPLERYGEVISGGFIVAVGIASFFWL